MSLNTTDTDARYHLRSTFVAKGKHTSQIESSLEQSRHQAHETTIIASKSFLKQHRESASSINSLSSVSSIDGKSRLTTDLSGESLRSSSEAQFDADVESNIKHAFKASSANTRTNSPVEGAAVTAGNDNRSTIALTNTKIFNLVATQFLTDLRFSFAVAKASMLSEIDSRSSFPPNIKNVKSRKRVTPSPRLAKDGAQRPKVTNSKRASISSSRLASHNSQVEIVIECFTEFWSLILRTWLLCEKVLSRINAIARFFLQTLIWISLLLSIVADIIFILILMMIFAFLVWTAVWALSTSIIATNHVAKTVCRWFWISLICSYDCDISSWLVLYMFFITCSHHTSRSSHVVKPYWGKEIDFISEMNNISRSLSVHETSCNYYSEKIPQIRHDLAISEDVKDILALTQDVICSYIRNISSDLLFYYRHVNIFSKSLLHQVSVTQTHIQSALSNRFSQNLLVEQKMINEKVPSIMSKWHERYEFLENSGAYVSAKVRDSRQKIVELLNRLQEAKSKTLRAKKTIIKTWNLSRRVDRSLDLLRSNSEDLYSYNDVIEVIDEWFVEARSLEILLTLIWSNVTELSGHLSDLTTTKLSADVRFQLGSEELLELHSYMIELRLQARGIQKTVDGARVIKREEVVKQRELDFEASKS